MKQLKRSKASTNLLGRPQSVLLAQMMLCQHTQPSLRCSLQLLALHAYRAQQRARKRRRVLIAALSDASDQQLLSGPASASGHAPQGKAAAEAGPVSLLLACTTGDARQVKRLLEAGVDLNTQDPATGETPLAAASGAGHADCVKALLIHKADAYLYDHQQVSPLMRAAQAGQPTIVHMLLTMGYADAYHVSSSGSSALLEAATRGCCQSISVLVEDGGADVNMPSETDGNHPLLAAARHGHLRAVKLLVKLGAKVNRTDKQGHTAIYAASSNGDAAMAQFLLSKGAKTAIADFVAKQTPLAVAAIRGTKGVVKLLLGAADVEAAVAITDAQGRSVMQLCGSPDVRALLQAYTGQKTLHG